MTTTEVLVAAPNGTLLADLNVVPLASHIVNDVGDASFTMSLTDAKAKERFLQFGNVLIINNDELPPWVGFIDSSLGRDWNGDSVTIRALSAEIIMNRRIVYPQQLAGTSGALLRAMLNNLNAASEGGLKIYPGDIYMGGPTHYYPIIGRCRDVMDRIAKRGGKCDWSVTHKIIDGKVKLFANLYKGERGAKTGRVLDYRNTELIAPLYTEDGEIWNHVVFMKPLDESGEVKICDPQRDEKSIGLYGLHMYLGEANAEEEEGLIWMARAWLYDHAYPRGMCAPTILNLDSVFKTVRLGNIYRWENHSVGFENGYIGTGDEVRMTGFEVDYATDKVRATVESTTKPFDIMTLFNQ